jgi:alkanesulfonate monooxygenase SsuD/methylene tetrahydromethanopterin reductase-like flavin-dependent oxidoreductase (luciferase family)
MPTQRPFRFGVSSHGMASRDELYGQARKAEHLGYATFLVNDHLNSTLAATDQKVAWIQAAAGARFAALELSISMPFVAVTEKPQEAAARYVQDLGMADYMTPQQFLESPHCGIGSIDQIIERLQAHRERYTCSYFVIHDHNMEQFAPIVARLTGM